MLAALAQVHWLAVALATLAYYALGAAWFTPLFGKSWDHAIGHERSKDSRFGLDYYLVPLASAALVTVALALILVTVAPHGIGEALAIGLLIGLGIAAPVSVNNALTPHTRHPYRFGAITGGYHFVGVLAASAIIGSFSG